MEGAGRDGSSRDAADWAGYPERGALWDSGTCSGSVRGFELDSVALPSIKSDAWGMLESGMC
jgi:hypothetical protein